VFDFEFNQIETFSIDPKMNINIPCSVHPEKGLFSVIHEKQALCIFDFQGNRIKNFAGNYACAAFNTNGDLWAFERISHEQLKWTMYDADWEIVATIDMEDPMYDSSLFLTSIPGSNDMILDFAAGQDGSAIHLLTNSGNLSSKDLFPDQCLSSPVFNEDGTRFLTLEFYDGILYHYSYPQLEMLGKYEYERDEVFEQGGTILYINSETAVISYNSRYFLLNIGVEEMKVIEEIMIDGHEPEAVEKFYPRLGEDKSLMTDIPFMMTMNRKIFASVDFSTENKVLVFDEIDFAKD
jgi:hypothetical protein